MCLSRARLGGLAPTCTASCTTVAPTLLPSGRTCAGLGNPVMRRAARHKGSCFLWPCARARCDDSASLPSRRTRASTALPSRLHNPCAPRGSLGKMCSLHWCSLWVTPAASAQGSGDWVQESRRGWGFPAASLYRPSRDAATRLPGSGTLPNHRLPRDPRQSLPILGWSIRAPDDYWSHRVGDSSFVTIRLRGAAL